MNEDAFVYHRSEQFAMTPKIMVLDMTISHPATRLYDYMCIRGGPDHRLDKDRESMAQIFDTSETSITSWVKQLAAKDWVIVEETINSSGRKANKYHVFGDQNDAIQWRIMYETELRLTPKPDVISRKSRKGIGGRGTHKPKETQVNVGSQKIPELTGAVNLSSSPLGNIDPSPELNKDQPTDLLSLAPASPALKKNIQVGRVQEEDLPVDTYIGRAFRNRSASPWQNLYVMDKPGKKAAGTRLEVNAKHLYSILQNDALLARLPELFGQTLRCYCDPDLCHGHSLKLLAEMDEVTLQRWRHAAKNIDDPVKLLADFMDEVRDGGIKAAYLKALGDHNQAQANAAREAAKSETAATGPEIRYIGEQSPAADKAVAWLAAGYLKKNSLHNNPKTIITFRGDPLDIKKRLQDTHDPDHITWTLGCSFSYGTDADGRSHLGINPHERRNAPPVKQIVIDDKKESPPTEISVEGWYPAGSLNDAHDQIKRSGYFVVDSAAKVIYFKRFKTKQDAESSDLFKSIDLEHSFAWSARDIQQGWCTYTLLKPATDIGITPEERAVIDGYYDGLPEARRPMVRIYDGKNRENARIILDKGYTAVQVRAAVGWQYAKDNLFWPPNAALMTLNHVRDYLPFWVTRMPAGKMSSGGAVPSGEETNLYLQDPFFRDNNLDEAYSEPLTPRQNRLIDEKLSNWWLAECGQLKTQLNAQTFNLYIKSLKLIEAHDNQFWLEAPGEMQRLHVETKMLQSIREALARIGLKDRSRWNEIQITLEIEGQVVSQLEVVT